MIRDWYNDKDLDMFVEELVLFVGDKVIFSEGFRLFFGTWVVMEDLFFVDIV